tara:strand:+ start:7164 stop:7400 length:237 start_codon:yes stop_codon:yes gene_type:complete
MIPLREIDFVAIPKSRPRDTDSPVAIPTAGVGKDIIFLAVDIDTLSHLRAIRFEENDSCVEELASSLNELLELKSRKT